MQALSRSCPPATASSVWGIATPARAAGWPGATAWAPGLRLLRLHPSTTPAATHTCRARVTPHEEIFSSSFFSSAARRLLALVGSVDGCNQFAVVADKPLDEQPAMRESAAGATVSSRERCCKAQRSPVLIKLEQQQRMPEQNRVRPSGGVGRRGRWGRGGGGGGGASHCRSCCRFRSFSSKRRCASSLYLRAAQSTSVCARQRLTTCALSENSVSGVEIQRVTVSGATTR
jgi:hypothetical protein